MRRPSRLKRYREIGSVLWRHGRGDLADLRPRGLLDEGGREERDDAAIAASAAAFAADLERLGPTFVKLGQVLSTRPDLLPAPYVHALERLQDDVAPFPFDDVERIVREELSARVSKAFASFDEKPMAAASLGQVHRAVLRDGRKVVVKVQRPGIRDRIRSDLDALDRMAELVDRHTKVGRTYRFHLMLEEFKESLCKELDYRAEEKNLELIGAALAEFPRIVVPRPVRSYTTSRVLTMDYVSGTKITSLSPLAHLDLDGRSLAEELFRAYLKQILVDGAFHADPHPGNVLVTDDGKIGLVDLGQVGHLSPRWRDGVFRLLLAVAEGRSEDAADVAIEFSEVSERFDERMLRRRVAAIVAWQQHATVEEVEVGRLVFEIARASSQSGLYVPSELTMLGKTLAALDQVGRALAPDFKPNEAVRDASRRLMAERLKQEMSQASLMSKAIELNELVTHMPARASRVLDRLARDQLKIKVDVIDEHVIVEGVQKVANRITLGLVVAALIVGSAMLMRIETKFTLLGYPGLAILFFFAAVLCGLGLAFEVLVRDEKPRRRRPAT